MSSEVVVNIAVALLVPIVTAVLGVLGIVFGDWRLRRTQAGRRKLALEDASRQVSFAAEWWNARKLLADSPQAEQEATARAVAWLEEASALVAESQLPPVEEKPAISLRRLLLLYPLQSRAATVLRGAFYVCLAVMPLNVGGIIHDALDPATATEILYQDIAILLVTAVVALGLRFWIGRIDKPRPRGRKRRGVQSMDTLEGELAPPDTAEAMKGTLRRVLLFYPFHRPAARIARLVLYIWVTFSTVFAALLLMSAWGYPYYFPGTTVQILAFIGYAVALRYWAASLEATRKDSEASRVPFSTATVDKPRGQ